MPKIYVPSRGFVYAGDQAEIDMLLAEGGRVVVKNKEIDQPIDDLIADPLIDEPVNEKETPEPLISEPAEPVKVTKATKFKSKLK